MKASKLSLSGKNPGLLASSHFAERNIPTQNNNATITKTSTTNDDDDDDGIDTGKFIPVLVGGSLVTTAWRVLRLRTEGSPSRTADKGWFSILGVGYGANNPSP
jgi:hypothetical protein